MAVTTQKADVSVTRVQSPKAQGRPLSHYVKPDLAVFSAYRHRAYPVYTIYPGRTGDLQDRHGDHCLPTQVPAR